jgi:hypothetical protein
LLFELIKPILKAMPTPMPSPAPLLNGQEMGLFIFLMLFSTLMYFIPALVGMRHKQAGAIFVLNLFLGWTFVGWVIALVWACTHKD